MSANHICYFINLDIINYVLVSAKKRLAMLDLLIAAYRKGQIDDSGMREEVDTFIFEVKTYSKNKINERTISTVKLKLNLLKPNLNF